MIKRFIHLVLAVILSLLYMLFPSGNTFCQNNSSEFYMENSNLGKNFWIALPQNALDQEGIQLEGIEIIVVPVKKTDVTLEYYGSGFVKTIKDAEPFQPVEFSFNNNIIGESWIVKEGEKVENKGIHIYSDELVAVSSINVRKWSSEGFLAIPTEAWGTEYLHCSYYDDHENNRDRGSGFIIVSGHNGTNVKVELRGKGQGLAQTLGGRDIGETFNVTLNKGQTYFVRGDGTVDGAFDLSGTKLTSEKPFGVISCHVRTNIPSSHNSLFRDNLAETLMPLRLWGQNFVTVEFSRQQSGGRTGKGDLLRIMTSRASNKIQCGFYDRSTGKLYSQPSPTLNKEGSYYSPLEVNHVPYYRNSNTCVYGVTSIQCSEPAQVMQYAFSMQWDGDLNWDPMQINIPPVEQFVSNAVFVTPSDHLGFNTNELNLFAIADPSDDNFETLKTVTLDGEEIHKKHGVFITNKIPGTNIHWVKITVQPGVHIIRSKTKFGGYLTGFKVYYSYGWPISTGTIDLENEDYNYPEINVSGECGEYNIEASDDYNDDSGIRRAFLIEEESSNYVFEWISPDKFDPANKIKQVKFKLEPVDNNLYGKAKFAVLDRANNVVIDSVEYFPDSLLTEYKEIDFGKSRVSDTIPRVMAMFNNSKAVLEVLRVRLAIGDHFEIVEEDLIDGFVLDTIGGEVIHVNYLPYRENPDDPDYDTLIFETECNLFKVNLQGSGIMPRIAVTDYDFGEAKVEERLCLEEINGNGFRIENRGSDDLTVKAIAGFEEPFEISNTTPGLPIELQPGELVYLKSICFMPLDTGDFSTTVTIKSDAMGGDSLSLLAGRGYKEQDTTDIFEKEKLVTGLKIIPNPVNKKDFIIRFTSQESRKIDISVVDLMGNELLRFDEEYIREGENSFRIELQNASTGMYLLFIKSPEINIVKKFILLN